MSKPTITLPLVEMVEAAFPNKCPALGFSDREVWYKAGQASVATYLRTLHNQQQDNILERKLNE